mmetsp:Transcript_31843/g.56193  ORF Transcript_31843/g.56193 Transcript_31843/m.56193 type:complete len:115 (+) Transcript_31843:335-679(+)
MGVKRFPTIKYYSPKTGLKGEMYEDKMDFGYFKDFMISYFKKLCVPLKRKFCDDKELDYIEKWDGRDTMEIEDEADRLEDMMKRGRQMNVENKQWVNNRIAILRALEHAPHTEL